MTSSLRRIWSTLHLTDKERKEHELTIADLTPTEKVDIPTIVRSKTATTATAADPVSNKASTASDPPEASQSHPQWSTTLATSILTLKTFLDTMNTDTIDQTSFRRIRALSAITSVPTSFRVSIDKVYVPRRADLILEDMKEEEATGFMKAEWIEYEPPTSLSFSFSSVLKKKPSHESLIPEKEEAVILYIHGGAYCVASRKTHRGITWKLAKYANCKVLSIDYRLAPEYVFPLALHDAISAYAFLTSPPPELNLKKCNPKKVVIMGDSAGGGLSLALLLWLRDNGSKHGLEMPGGAGLLSPWLDLTHSTRSYKTNGKWDYLPDKMRGKLINESRSHYYVKDNTYLKHPLVSPLFATEAHQEKPLCPILIHIGECERLRDENLVFVSRVFKESPIQLEMYDTMVHVFQMFNNFLPLAELALERLGMFVQKVTTDGFEGKQFSRTFSRFGCEDGFAVSDLTKEEINAYLLEDDERKDEEQKQEEKTREVLEVSVDNVVVSQ
ncbi:UNVERIFIED_CONTAM: hypothetical protein HDU68_008396 [Siphonaria sp. JEL0065]|nr:hypothetical protein HDU68_008396 [Siphonaria sp. JEL0065]